MPFDDQGARVVPARGGAARARARRSQRPTGDDDAWIDFAGPAADASSDLSFVDVAQRPASPGAAVRGKVVVVGATAPVAAGPARHVDHQRASLMPGPEIQANAIAPRWPASRCASAPWWLERAARRRCSASPRRSPRCACGIVPGGRRSASRRIVALLVGAQLAFERAARSSPSSTRSSPGSPRSLLTAAIHGLTVAFEREQARDAFARFVPEAVVDQVLADADGVRLGGVRGEATVMFSDLRGFTSFSETLEPERVIESLNRYLTEMSEAILDHGGTLVAYMGDGIMAVFGAPLKQDDHADRALEAAREMLDADGGLQRLAARAGPARRLQDGHRAQQRAR